MNDISPDRVRELRAQFGFAVRTLLREMASVQRTPESELVVDELEAAVNRVVTNPEVKPRQMVAA